MLFELALGLSAWKQYGGNRWALRCNPSSGNLHPTEGYAVLPELPGLAAGVYHYVSRDHVLERRCALEGRAARQLAEVLPPASFLVGLSSIHWREAWKYGSVPSATASTTPVTPSRPCGMRPRRWAGRPGCSPTLGSHPRRPAGAGPAGERGRIAEADREHPDALLLVGPLPLAATGGGRGGLTWPCCGGAPGGTWAGRANPLSPAHVPWPAIDAAAEATWREDGAAAPGHRGNGPRRPRRRVGRATAGPACPPYDSSSNAGAAWRSTAARRWTPHASTPCSTGCCPGPTCRRGTSGRGPRTCTAASSCTGSGGCRQACTSSNATRRLTRASGPGLAADLAWTRPASCPDSLPFFALAGGDVRERAAVVSCHQAIAAAGAFSLGMLADFADSIRAAGAWWYRRLFWEAGLLGQVLYLEAEAAGLRGTGIGCYFDDAFHDVLGLRDDRFQSLYHFTVGGPVDDPRLTTLPAYFHLDPARHEAR